MPRLIDAHHHIWRLHRVPWLNGPPVPRIFGDYEALRADYTGEHYRRDIQTGAQAVGYHFDGSVYVQVNVATGEEDEEVRWVSAQSARTETVKASVAFCDLRRPDTDAALDRLMKAGRVCGIRQQLHHHSRKDFSFADSPDLMLDPNWQRGLRCVVQRGLPFDLQVFPDQFADTLKMIDRFPDATFILVHAGMLQDRTNRGLQQWRDGLAALAQRPGVSVKLSGLGTFVRRCDPETWAPIIRYVVDTFGPNRCLFGSNLPVENLWTSAEELLEVVLEALSPYDDAETDAVLHRTARRVYALPEAISPDRPRHSAST